jgi:ribose transport system ATP-binding protein
MEELKVISDRITVMRDGQYIDTLYTKDTDMKKVISLMVGRHIQDESRPTTTVSKEAETVLEVKNLSTKNFLENISFTLKKGEILGFAGLMGAGRTEVARAIFGADKIDEGQIFINGKEVKINKPEDAVKHGIAYLSEDRKRYGLMLEMDVNSNILISSLSNYVNWLTFVNDSKGYVTSEEYVKSLKIKTPSIKQLAKNLSGGNQQKIVIAKWLAKNCDILIFDEPTRGIDVGAKTEIYQLLNELAQQGKSIIMISSELPEILRMSHRIIVMCEGRITGELTNEEASQEKIMDYATRTRS